MTQYIRVVRAHESETVEIQWTLGDRSVYTQRFTVPPKAVREARPPVEPPDAVNQAGQVTDRTHTNESGQRYNIPPSTSLDAVGTTGGKATTEVQLPKH